MLDRYGDILAIPFFAWLSIYFHQIPNRTNEETMLFIFSFGGLVADVLFTMKFLHYFGTYNIFICSVIYMVGVYILHNLIFHHTFTLSPI